MKEPIVDKLRCYAYPSCPCKAFEVCIETTDDVVGTLIRTLDRLVASMAVFGCSEIDKALDEARALLAAWEDAQ